MPAAIASPTARPDEGPLERVVLATDFGEASAGAVRLASDLARAFDAELLIVHVLPDLDSPRSVKRTLGMEPGDLLERRAGEAEGHLRGLESMLGRGHAHATVRCGSAATEIVRLANETAADLIVLGSHGPTAPRGACGPVAERVRERARCPVLVAPAPGERRPASGATPDRPIHGLLVATDLTSRSDAAVRWGGALGRRLGCPVHVVHVTGTRRRRRQVPGAAKPDIIRAGDPVAQIVACARELGDDLIVLGSPRRGALHGALLRSVGREVVERAGLPTLTARWPVGLSGARGPTPSDGGRGSRHSGR